MRKKFFLSFVIVSVFCFSLLSCHKREVMGMEDYDRLYADTFNQLINGLDKPLELSDTIYTELYIAMMTCSPSRYCINNEICDTFYAKYEKLKEVDTLRQYIDVAMEMKVIVLSLQGKEVEAMQLMLERNRMKPDDDFEKASFWGAYHYVLGNSDSASFYLNTCIMLCDNVLEDRGSERIKDAILNKWQALVLLGRDEDASMFIDSLYPYDGDDEINDILLGIKDNPSAAASEYRESVEETRSLFAE